MDIQTNGTAAGTILYEYEPSPAAAIIFVVAFGIALIFHFVTLIWLRTAYFIPLCIGCIMDCFGYYGRYWSSQSPHNFGAFILQSFMLILAPIFFAATAYVSLARVVLELRAARSSILPPRWLSRFFILADILCFLVQVVALGMQATTSLSVQATGRMVLIIGLVVQCIVTILFGLSAYRVLRKPGDRVMEQRERGRIMDRQVTVPWKKFVRALVAVSVLLFVRNVFRAAEYAEGPTGNVAYHEVYVYLFDALPMLALVTTILIYHPGRLQRTIRRIDQNLDRGSAEVKRRDDGR